jgi:acyl carrier protein
MNKPTPDQVREFLIDKYSEPIRGLGLEQTSVPEDFDLLTNGVVDSFGILEMITAIEEQFNLQLDMANLDAEQLTILGPLCRYVAENAI